MPTFLQPSLCARSHKWVAKRSLTFYSLPASTGREHALLSLSGSLQFFQFWPLGINFVKKKS
jgi:hypothetical protein